MNKIFLRRAENIPPVPYVCAEDLAHNLTNS